MLVSKLCVCVCVCKFNMKPEGAKSKETLINKKPSVKCVCVYVLATTKNDIDKYFLRSFTQGLLLCVCLSVFLSYIVMKIGRDM